MLPDGFIVESQSNMACKLQISIYGLKQASQPWNIKFDEMIKHMVLIKTLMNYVCTKSVVKM
jgi:hypothetical protein